MKIRTQLVLACFVLSVLPLTGIVLYSYHSSRNAVEAAYRQEAQRLTRNMDGRLATIRAELDERMASLSAIEIPAGDASSNPNAIVDSIMTAIGEAAPLVEALEYIPVRAPPPPPRPAPQPQPRAAAAVVASRTPTIPIEVFGEVEEAALVMAEPIVIDLPPVVMPRYEMTPLAQTSMAEVGRLSAELAQSADRMSREERAAKKQRLREKSAIFEQEVEKSREKFHAEMKTAQEQLAARRRRQQALRDRQRDAVSTRVMVTQTTPPAPVVAPAPPTPSTPAVAEARPVAAVRAKSDLSPAERQSIESKHRKARLVLGRRFDVPVEKEGEVVGQIRAQLKADEVIRRVLGGQAGDRDEIPFAVDRETNIYTRNETERAMLERLGIPARIKAGRSLADIPDWIVVATRDEESGLRVGVARPVGGNLIELRQTAARNFGYGMGLIAFALIGIVPLANHFTRDVKRVTAGAERIAQGDLQTRIPVRGNDEFGQLALAFNKMAEDLSDHQRRLFAGESARREQEVQQRLMAVEYDRKSSDLEEARRFQLSMLPKELPKHRSYDVAVFTRTATEVGGDYYDFHEGQDETLSVTIGDATGHGARAGTMVTVIKTLFAGYHGSESPAAFLSEAAETIKRMELGRMAMALSLARFDSSGVTVATAGMPPMLIHRRKENRIDEIALPATPLGTLGVEYAERRVSLDPGDTILLMSDGFPELLNTSAQQLGYPLALEEFKNALSETSNAQGIIDSLHAAVQRWHGDQPPNDDITFVVVRKV